MKRAVLLLVCCLMLTGCAKKHEAKPVEPVNTGTVYEIESAIAYTLGADGTLYVLADEPVPGAEWDRQSKLLVYGPETNLLKSVPFETPLAAVKSMTEQEEMLYWGAQTIGKNGIQTTVYAYDTRRDQLSELVNLPELLMIYRVVLDSEGMYVLGSDSERDDAEKQLRYYSFSTRESKRIPIEHVVDIGMDEKNEIFFCVEQEGGYGILQYNRAENMIRKLCDLKGNNVSVMAFSHEGMLYQSYSYNLVWSAFDAADVESDIIPEAFSMDYSLCVKNDRIACMGFDRKIRVLSFQDARKANRTIRFLTASLFEDSCFGCGYQIEKQEYSADKIALKVLAMDQDYDVSLLSSFSQTGRSIMEHGGYYPLNEVPGVEEYLSKCFPYVREMATKDDGSIWMLPVDIKMDALMVDETEIRRLGITDSFENLTFERLIEIQRKLPEAERKRTFFYDPERFAMMQYFISHTSVDTDEFRALLETLQQGKNLFYRKDIQDFLYKRQPGIRYTLVNTYREKYGEGIRFYGLPRQDANGKNFGTCDFLVVNPKSDNLEATLSYISSLVSYQCSREKELPFFNTEPEMENETAASIYNLYRDGEICFNIPEELFEGYLEVLNGQFDREKYIQETEQKLRIYFNE